VFFWGQGFRQERILTPKLLFVESRGVKDLKLGWSHVLYVDEVHNDLFSWGDTTFG